MPEILEGILISETSETGGLVTIETKKPIEVFTDPGVVDALVEAITRSAKAFTPSVQTSKGRQEIASRAFRVAQSKTYLESIGKDVAAELKELPKKVDASRKLLRDKLDALRDEVRAPLNEWEAEQARLEAEKKAAEEAAALARQIEADHELAILLDEKFDREAQARREAEEQALREREEAIRREADEKARQEAALAIERASQEKREAERRLKEAEERAEQARKEAEAREAKAKEDAIEAERKRVQEAERLEQEARVRREQDTEHRRAFNREAMADIEAAIRAANPNAEGLSAMAESVVRAVATGKIRHIAITY